MLTSGTRLGPYEIVSAIGAGGMGEVYRARDAQLNRDVAIKILPDLFALDPERLARFTREAQTLASLNHANIAHVYGVVDRGLVMELVEGDDLSTIIARGPLPLAEALAIARQIADALEAAHESGIIHRDLKPANVKVRPDGTVKVLDFGLAKAMDPPGSQSSPNMANSPTFTAHATHLGLIIGTAAYMAPEQARGKAVDRRADIWAFGVVLFEMLTGRRAFDGDSVSEILASVLKDTPPMDALPRATPPGLRRLIERCLDRDPKNRLRDIGEARIEIGRIEAGAGDIAGERAAGTAGPPRWRRALPWAVAAVLATALAVSVAVTPRSAPTGPPLRRFTLSLPAKAAPNWNDFDVAVSPDGTQLAYNCRDGNTVGLCVRALDSLTARRIIDDRDAEQWFFSPDGEWLGIADDVGLSKVSIRGGEPQRLVKWPGTDLAPSGFGWGPAGDILFGTRTGLQRVPAAGGKTETVVQITAGSGIAAYTWPSHLPDGRTALITIVHADGSESAGLVDLSNGSVRDLGVHGSQFVYMPGGWLAFRQGTTLLAIRFDPADPTRTTSPVPIVENVGRAPKIARDGTLVYVPTRGESSARLVWVDRGGRPTAIGSDRLDYTHLDLAPDGRHALLNLEGGVIDLIDLQSGTRKQVARGGFPIWSAKGDRVTFRGDAGLLSAPTDGSAPPDLLVAQPGFVVPTSWNGVTGDLAYYDHRHFEIWIRSADGKTRRFLGAPGRKRSGRFSPDGKWMAFVSDETGDYQVYVTAYPGPGATVAVSRTGGLSPIWSADGRELFFRLGGKVMATRMTGTQPPAFATPVELFDGPFTLDLMGHQREDLSPDGRSFLMVENSDDFPIVIVQNWAVELQRLVR